MTPDSTIRPVVAQQPAARDLAGASQLSSGALSSVEVVLGRSYADLNANAFDAKRYFEPSVERYITMMNTNTGATKRSECPMPGSWS